MEKYKEELLLSSRYLFTSESVTEGHPDKICVKSKTHQSGNLGRIAFIIHLRSLSASIIICQLVLLTVCFLDG